MTLTAGTRLGPYEIASQIGKGGMGEVYRALDTILARQVAIKILPDSFAHDPERLALFEREAKMLTALNHPNIAQIYGFERAEGSGALVMELVEGVTLEDRIATGPIPLNEALPIARQIADALEAAHDKGIIHRDLKPANIKIAANGSVKVLDFGLAKVWDGVPSAMSGTPTVTASQFGERVILGTPAYMSPEQARGRSLDKRTDIWSFGCVFFEMLTGRTAFGADTIHFLETFQYTHDGIDWNIPPFFLGFRDGRPMNQAYGRNHDRLARSNALSLGVGVSFALTEKLGVFGTFTKLAWGENLAAPRSVTVGMNVGFQTRAASRPRPNVNRPLRPE